MVGYFSTDVLGRYIFLYLVKSEEACDTVFSQKKKKIRPIFLFRLCWFIVVSRNGRFISFTCLQWAFFLTKLLQFCSHLS